MTVIGLGVAGIMIASGTAHLDYVGIREAWSPGSGNQTCPCTAQLAVFKAYTMTFANIKSCVRHRVLQVSGTAGGYNLGGTSYWSSKK